MSQQILKLHAEDNFFEPGQELEIANVLSGMSQLGYRNAEVIEALHGYLLGAKYKETGEVEAVYDMFTLYNLITSYARLVPQNADYLTCFVPQLHECLTELYKIPKEHVSQNPILIQTMVPDISMFVNLWLSLATFTAMQPNYKQMTALPAPFKLITKDLIKIFGQNERWNATEINLQEAANISVAIAILKVGNERFIGDVGDIIRMLIQEEAQAEDLPNLVKSTFYMRNFKYSRDLYSQVHATAFNLYNSGDMPQEVFAALQEIYTS